MSVTIFFEGQEQCLQSWLGSVVVSRLVTVDWQNIQHVRYFTDPPQLDSYSDRQAGNCVSLPPLINPPEVRGETIMNIYVLPRAPYLVKG